MENLFYHTFKPVIRVANNGGVYLPNCEIIYPSFGRLIKLLVHLNLFLAITDFFTLTGGEFSFLQTGEEALGMTKYYMVLGLGTLAPSFVRVVYLQAKSEEVKRLIDIWERDLSNPPHQEDRDAEIARVQRTMSKIVKIQVFGFIIPLTIWSARPVVTRQEVIPTGFPGDHYKSPTFELITTFIAFTGYYVGSVWSAFESVQILFMQSIMAELNHLELAIDKMFIRLSDDQYEGGGIIGIFEYKNGVMTALSNSEIGEVRRLLRTWIIHHQILLRFSDGINEFFGPMILLQNVCTMVFAFTSLFTVVLGEVRLDNRIEACSYLAFYYYVLFRTCQLGDEIQLKSKNIMDEFNGKDWYLYPRDVIKSVLIIQNVTKNRPIKLRATGFKDLSCKSFGEITQKGYELITFMAQFLRRHRT